MNEYRVKGRKNQEGEEMGVADHKLAILREWERTGNGVEIAVRYQIHPHTLYRWKKRLDSGARELLKGTRAKKDILVKRLQEENRKLKEALVLQSQELIFLKKEMNLV